MDLDKLAKLSCLEIKPEDREFFTNSLTSVFEIMDTVASLDAKATNDNLPQSTIFDSLSEDITAKDTHTKEAIMIDRETQYKGIHLEQGVFLAPKVIKKD
jgi:Asp-tRNA(Asn)/Glu-tRNA(Gln) amidotransferase C subunit